MLPRASLGDNALLAHPSRKQCLAEAVVDLVRSRMQQVFPLEIDGGAAQMLAETSSVKKGSGTSRILPKEVRKFLMESRVVADRAVGGIQAVQRSHENLWRVTTAEVAEAAHFVRHGACNW